MAVDVLKREHTQWHMQRVTEHGVLQNSVMRILSSPRWWSFHFYWNVTRDGKILFTQSWRGNSSSCMKTVWDVKILHVMGSVATHGRTSNKLCGSGTQLSYSVWGEWESLARTRTNNYWWWMFYKFLQGRKKINANGLGKKSGIHIKWIQEWAIRQAGDVNSLLGLPQLSVHWIWSWRPQREVKYHSWH